MSVGWSRSLFSLNRYLGSEFRRAPLTDTSPTANYPSTIHLPASLRHICWKEQTRWEHLPVPNRTVDHNICENQHPDLCHHCQGDDYFEACHHCKGDYYFEAPHGNVVNLGEKNDCKNGECWGFSLAVCFWKREKLKELSKSVMRPFFFSEAAGNCWRKFRRNSLQGLC